MSSVQNILCQTVFVLPMYKCVCVVKLEKFGKLYCMKDLGVLKTCSQLKINHTHTHLSTYLPKYILCGCGCVRYIL